MKAFCLKLAVAGLIALASAPAWAALSAPTYQWTVDLNQALPPVSNQGSAHYLNGAIDLIDVDLGAPVQLEHVLVGGRTGDGAYILRQNGSIFDSVRTNAKLATPGNNPGVPPPPFPLAGPPAVGAKSGGFKLTTGSGTDYYFGANNNSGIFRANTTLDLPSVEGKAGTSPGGPTTNAVSLSGGVESITSDGVSLFANNSAGLNLFGNLINRNQVRKVSVVDAGTTFSLSTTWTRSVGDTSGRVRGIDYDPMGAGFVFAHPNDQVVAGGRGGELWSLVGASGATDVVGAFDPTLAIAVNNPGDPNRGINAITGATSQVWGVDVYEDRAFIVSDNGYLTVMELALFDIDPGPGVDLRPRATGVTESYDMQLIIPGLEGGLALLGVAVTENDATPLNSDDLFIYLSFEADGEGQKRRIAGFTADFPAIVPGGEPRLLAFTGFSDVETAPANPEPAAGLLLALGAIGLLGRGRTRRSENCG